MKILFIGCVQFSYTLLEHLLSIQDPRVEVAGIITKKQSPINSDFKSLEPIAKKHKIPCYLVEKNDQESMANWIRQNHFDVIYCFGWSYLLKPEILNMTKIGVVGYHPTNLPQNRGRHPIIWALALGLKETASTFFFMDEGPDSGDILNQQKVIIEESDNAYTLYNKLIYIAKRQIIDITEDLVEQNFKRVPQDHTKANYWRKRTKKDGEIDWRMSSKTINNLIRALTRPYPGAHFVFNGREIKVWKAQVVESATVMNLEPGKVFDVSSTGITVKCGEGAITLIEHELNELPEVGSYL